MQTRVWFSKAFENVHSNSCSTGCKTYSLVREDENGLCTIKKSDTTKVLLKAATLYTAALVTYHSITLTVIEMSPIQFISITKPDARYCFIVLSKRKLDMVV